MVSMFPTPLITQYLLSFQSPWEITLRVAPLWFQVPTAVQQSSTCLLPSGWCPLVVSEGLKSCNTIQLYMYHKSSKIINIQHLLLESIIILVQYGLFCFKTCLIYKFIISIFIANTHLFLKCTILDPYYFLIGILMISEEKKAWPLLPSGDIQAGAYSLPLSWKENL